MYIYMFMQMGTQEITKRFDACTMVPENILSKAYKTKLKPVHPDKYIGNEIDANKMTNLLVNAWGRLKVPTERRLSDNDMRRHDGLGGNCDRSTTRGHLYLRMQMVCKYTVR